MTDTALTYARAIEQSASTGNLSAELQRTSDNIKASASSPAAADKMLQEVTEELNKRGIGKIAAKWTSENFRHLDLDGNGSISASELDRMLTADLLKNATNPLEKQILRYLQANRERIAASVDDEWGKEKNITRRDVEAYERQSSVAQRLAERFGDQSRFNALAGKDKLITYSELKSALAGKNGTWSGEDKELIQFMVDNFDTIAKRQSKWHVRKTISISDVTDYPSKVKPDALPSSATQARDFTEQADKAKNAAKPSTGELPDLILEFGKENIRAFDFNGDGKIGRDELHKVAKSEFWNRGQTRENMRIMNEMENKFEYIQRSHKDQWYKFKDTNGLSLKDLEAYAKFESQNRADLPKEPGDHKLVFTVGGVKRDCTMHIPPGLDLSKPVRMVYLYHYFTGNSEQMAKISEIREKADKEGFIVVTPNAKGWIGDYLRQFNLNNKDTYRVDELAFFDAMQARFKSKLNVEATYVGGYSNGGMLAQEIARERSKEVDAFASFAACQAGKKTDQKAPEVPVPGLITYSRGDWIVPASGSRYSIRRVLFPAFQSADYSREYYKQVLGTDQSKVDVITPGITREILTNSKTGKELHLYELRKNKWGESIGHTYPGNWMRPYDGGPCTEINATNLMWDFFKKYKKDTPSTSSKPAEVVPAKK